VTHVVPEHQRAAAERTLAATPGVRGEPTDAERSRTLIEAVRTGSLATIGEGGFPFGSLVSHAVDPMGRPLWLLRYLAEQPQRRRPPLSTERIIGHLTSSPA
jgi:heme oxygenase (biliverdin-IX-beta and delta-forming)